VRRSPRGASGRGAGWTPVARLAGAGGPGTGATPSGWIQDGAARREARGWTGEAAAARSELSAVSGAGRRGRRSRSKVTLMVSWSFDRSWKRVTIGQPRATRITACSNNDPQTTAPFLNRVLRAADGDWGKNELDRTGGKKFATADGETVSAAR
jgi:hypothetical protein